MAAAAVTRVENLATDKGPQKWGCVIACLAKNTCLFIFKKV